MSADALLARLEKVRKTGQDRWISRCPAHDDKSPSMTIRELDDGRTLIHCFSGCSADEILGALGLEFDALFPEAPLGHQAKRERRPFNAHDVLRCISFEALIVVTASKLLTQGQPLADTDRERVVLAASRIGAALELIDAR